MSTLTASINVLLALGDDVYTVNLALPSATPTAAAPFRFNVTSASKTAQPTDPQDPLLTVAIGTTSQVYVAVAPPNSLLVGAGVGDLVKQLNVIVAEGTYDTVNHVFTG